MLRIATQTPPAKDGTPAPRFLYLINVKSAVSAKHCKRLFRSLPYSAWSSVWTKLIS
jgi:hypothetical protein